MAKLHTIGKTIVTVYANDHLPPHFHILNPDFEALVEIRTLTILRGEIDGSSGREALEWAKDNISVIRDEWNRVNPRWPL
ncbi:MAG: DUF4160 domain-containing protein [Pseudomonadota bacterium]